MKNKRIVLAESSGTVSKVILSSLNDMGCEVHVVEDGLQVLEYVLANEVDCIVSNVMLPSVNGCQVASLLKNGSRKHWLPVLLYTTEENESSFWNEIEPADHFLTLSSQNLEMLTGMVEDALEHKEIYEEFVPEDVEQQSLENPVLCAVSAMEKKLFKYRLSEKALSIARNYREPDELAKEILREIHGVCDFDNGVLVLKGNPSRFFYAGPQGCCKEWEEDFKKICRSDYESKLNLSNSIDYEVIPVDGLNLSSVDEGYKSYRTFVFETEDGEFAGTVHLASSRRKFFSYRLISALEYFVSKLTYSLVQSMEYQELSVSKKRMHSAFTKFVPEEIISEMIKSDETQNESVTEKRRVAIMICDIRNFTTISEMNEPEAVVGFLNGYFSIMVEIIKKNGGSIDKFMGDAIMANFGAPISYSDNAKRAVDAALEMSEALKKIPCDMLAFSEKVSGIDIGIGIHYGEVIVGNIGCKEKTDYTVIGDSANLASRLEGLTKQYGARIIVSRDVIDGMEDAVRKDMSGNELKEVERKKQFAQLMKNYNFIQLDKVKVKGKLKGIEIYTAAPKKYSEEYRENYEKGLSLYFLGNFSYARDYFEKAKALSPSGKDKACNLMIGICSEFRDNPPDNWDGARELTSK